MAGVFPTFDAFVLRALVGVASPSSPSSAARAAGTAAVLRALFFCALPGAVLPAPLGGIVVDEKCAAGILVVGC